MSQPAFCLAAALGYGDVEFTLVDPTTVALLQAQLAFNARETIITYTQALGKTLGGKDVTSNVFEYPITVCRGCLIRFDTDLSREPVPNCYASAVMSPGELAPCFYGQDVPVDCHFCLDDPFCVCGLQLCPGGGVVNDGGIE